MLLLPQRLISHPEGVELLLIFLQKFRVMLLKDADYLLQGIEIGIHIIGNRSELVRLQTEIPIPRQPTGHCNLTAHSPTEVLPCTCQGV